MESVHHIESRAVVSPADRTSAKSLVRSVAWYSSAAGYVAAAPAVLVVLVSSVGAFHSGP